MEVGEPPVVPNPHLPTDIACFGAVAATGGYFNYAVVSIVKTQYHLGQATISGGIAR